MKRISVVGMLFAAVLLVSGCAHMPSAGWTTLIDGEKGMENLNRIGDANWRAEDGAIVADKGKGGHLVSKTLIGILNFISSSGLISGARSWLDHCKRELHTTMPMPGNCRARFF